MNPLLSFNKQLKTTACLQSSIRLLFRYYQHLLLPVYPPASIYLDVTSSQPLHLSLYNFSIHLSFPFLPHNFSLYFLSNSFLSFSSLLCQNLSLNCSLRWLPLNHCTFWEGIGSRFAISANCEASSLALCAAYSSSWNLIVIVAKFDRKFWHKQGNRIADESIWKVTASKKSNR